MPGMLFVVAPLTDDANTVDAPPGRTLTPPRCRWPATPWTRPSGTPWDLVRQAGAARGDLLLRPTPWAVMRSPLPTRARQQGVTVSVLGVGTAQGGTGECPGGGSKDPAGNIVVPRLDVAMRCRLSPPPAAALCQPCHRRERSRCRTFAVAAPAQAAPPPTDNQRSHQRRVARPRSPGWCSRCCRWLCSASGAAGCFLLMPSCRRHRACVRLERSVVSDPTSRPGAPLQATAAEQAAQLARDPGFEAARRSTGRATTPRLVADFAAARTPRRTTAAAMPWPKGAAVRAGPGRLRRPGLIKALASADAQANARCRGRLAEAPGKAAESRISRRPAGGWVRGPGQAGRNGLSPQSAQSQGADKPQDGEGKGRASGQPVCGRPVVRPIHAGPARGRPPRGPRRPDGCIDRRQPAASAAARGRAAAMERALAQPQVRCRQKGPGCGRQDCYRSRRDRTQREQRQAMEQWLQRVPDDPGGGCRGASSNSSTSAASSIRGNQGDH